MTTPQPLYGRFTAAAAVPECSDPWELTMQAEEYLDLYRRAPRAGEPRSSRMCHLTAAIELLERARDIEEGLTI